VEASELERLTQLITAQVLRQLQGSSAAEPAAAGFGKTVLAVFTGGYQKFDEALEQVAGLSRAGHSVVVLLSRNAGRQAGRERVLTATGASQVITSDDEMDPVALLEKVDAVAAPVLSRVSANKIAIGVADTLPTAVILEALLAGLPVVLATNACQPKSRLSSSTVRPAAPALIRTLQERLTALQSFGAELVDVGEIGAAINRRLVPPTATPQVAPLVKRVITNADVLAVGKGNELRVARGSVITPLARETAKSAGISVREE
jgi:hypothetical protein